MAPSEAGAPGLSAPATDVSIAGGISLYVPGPYLTDGIAFDRCGAVETIGPPATDRIRYTVVLAGADAPEERTFGVSVPEARLLPFDVGDVVHVRIGVRRIQIHAVLSGIVTDQAGRLLLGFSGEGDTTWAPGWSVAMGPITERIGSVRGHVLDVAYLGTRGRTAETAFVRLRTSDGSWLVLGSARTLARSRRGGPVVPPHDFSPYSTFAVLRER
ncbi:MAG: hypothetical protein HY996_01635 [Micrococcales bacterium]|nr:hypothetical protein [Micrococcales bacterium]